jgi:CRP-like cAMP-binding protein
MTPENLIHALLPQGKRLHLNRGDQLLRAGEIEKHLYVLQSGLVRVYYLNEYEDHTIRFGYTGSTINSLHSYLSQTPSTLFVECLKATELIAITKTDVDTFIAENQLYEAYSNILEGLAIQQIEREIDLLTHSPIERYQRVFARSPHLFLEAPAKYIASYLRMTPETLSRIRNS